MKRNITTAVTVIAATLCFIVGGADARTIVQVDVYGTVTFNATTGSPLSSVTVGQTAHTSFTVDSTVFINSIPGDVRAYTINQASFTLSFSGGASVGLTNSGGPSYFAVRDGDPVVDGFFMSQSTTQLGGVPLTQSPYKEDFHVTYGGTKLSSLDILDAVGTYDFTGLTVFGYNLWAASPDNVLMNIDFDHMTITAVPAPATLLAFAPLIFGGRRRRL